MKIEANWTAEDERQAEAMAEALESARHRCGGTVYYMGPGHYECLGCGWMGQAAPEGVKAKRFVRAEND